MRGYEITERGKIFIAILLVLLLLVLPSAILAFKVMAGDSSPPSGRNPGSLGETPSVSGTQPTEDTDDPPPDDGGGFNPSEEPSETDGLITGGWGEASPEASSGSGDNTESPPPVQIPSNGSGDLDDIDNNDADPSSGSPTDPTESPTPTDSAASPPPTDNITSPAPTDTTASPSPTDSPASPSPSDSSASPAPSPNDAFDSNPVLSSGVLTFQFLPGEQSSLDSKTSSKLSEFLNSSKNTRNSTIAIETSKLSDKDAETFMKTMTSAFAAKGVPAQRLEHVSRASETTGQQMEVKIYYVDKSEK